MFPHLRSSYRLRVLALVFPLPVRRLCTAFTRSRSDASRFTPLTLRAPFEKSPSSFDTPSASRSKEPGFIELPDETGEEVASRRLLCSQLLEKFARTLPHDAAASPSYRDAALSLEECSALLANAHELRSSFGRVFVFAFLDFCRSENLFNIGDSFVAFGLTQTPFRESAVNIASAIRFYSVFPERLSDGVTERIRALRERLVEIANKTSLPKKFTLSQQLLASSLCSASPNERADWRRTCLDLLARLDSLSALRSQHFSWLISGAARARDSSMLVALLRDVRARNMAAASALGVSTDAMLDIVGFVRSLHREDAQGLERLLKVFFECLGSAEQEMPSAVAVRLKSVVEPFGWAVTLAKTSRTGVCSACERQLAPTRFMLSSTDAGAELERLRSEFLDERLKTDIWRTTTPAELGAFMRLVDEAKPFDVVVDGLNVLYNAAHRKTGVRAKYEQFGDALECIAQTLNGRRTRILVVGRKHMIEWVRRLNLTEMASFVFIDDRSQDDALLLLAAMQCGLQTLIVSKDAFGGYDECLAPTTARFFRQWLRARKVGYVYAAQGAGGDSAPVGAAKGGITLMIPPTWSFDAQEDESGGWHVLYNEELEPRYAYQYPYRWLCVRPPAKRG